MRYAALDGYIEIVKLCKEWGATIVWKHLESVLVEG